MATPFIGEIRIFGFTFAPVGWAFCNGQLLPISQNTALFSLLGTTYGGDGQTTFALPDLRGRLPLHFGQGTGLTNRLQGQKAGEETHLLTVGEMPQHRHTMRVTAAASNTTSPVSNYLAAGGIYSTVPDTNTLDPAAINIAGANVKHNNMQPYLVLNFCIALQGIFPSRN